MFARVSVYEISSGRMDDAVESFGSALEQIRNLDGFSEAFVVVSPEDDRALAITLWASRVDVERSRVTASQARQNAARAVDGSVLSAHEYEVAIRVVGAGEPA